METLAAIADPTRRRIVEMLAERDRTAGEIVSEFRVSAPAISQHLKVLREAGWVTVRVDGQHRVQSLNPKAITEVEGWLARTKQFWSNRLDALERALEADFAKDRRKPQTNKPS
ncbi:MAG: metalloregulator ArsR/SmtB family transcription factor [Luteolibacter sp.]